MEWSEHRPRHTKFYFTLSYSNSHVPTNFHQNRTKIAKVCPEGGFWGGWGGLKIDPAPPSAHFKCFPPKRTSIPSFIKIGQKLWKLAHCISLVGGRVVGVVGVVPGTPNFILLLVILIYTSPSNFSKIG